MEQTIKNYEFVFIFFACFIVFLLISVLIKQKLIRKMSLLFFSITFVLFCFELILSFFMPLPNIMLKRQYVENIDKSNIIQQKDVKRNIDNSTLIYDKISSIYNNGFRFTRCNNNSQDVYIFCGCSFVFGLGLNDNETLPYYFSKLFNFNKNIINCGVVGQSTNTTLNILNNNLFFPLINNDKNINKNFFYSLIEDHINRNFAYEHYSFCCDGYLYKNNNWYIPTIIGKIKYIFARSYIFRKVFIPIIDEKLKQYYENYMIQSLEEINKIVEEKYKSKLTIIVWGEKEYSSYFINKLQKTNLDLIFLPHKFILEDTDYRIKYDGHPTAKANKEIAEILYNHINKID